MSTRENCPIVMHRYRGIDNVRQARGEREQRAHLINREGMRREIKGVSSVPGARL